MKTKNIITVLLIAVILASCAPAAKVAPIPTAVPTSTFTPIPTATSTSAPIPTATSTSAPIPTTISTSTPIPMINVENLSVPDPHFSNPDFFDFSNVGSPIVKFAKAFDTKPENVTAELSLKVEQDSNGNYFVVMVSTNGTMLLMAEKTENEEFMWKEATPGNYWGNFGKHVGASIREQEWKLSNNSKIFSQYFSDGGILGITTQVRPGPDIEERHPSRALPYLLVAKQSNMAFMFTYVVEPGKFPKYTTVENVDQWLERRLSEMSDAIVQNKPDQIVYLQFNEATNEKGGWNEDNNPLRDKYGEKWLGEYFYQALLIPIQHRLIPNKDYVLFINENRMYSETTQQFMYTKLKEARTYAFEKLLSDPVIKLKLDEVGITKADDIQMVLGTETYVNIDNKPYDGVTFIEDPTSEQINALADSFGDLGGIVLTEVSPHGTIEQKVNFFIKATQTMKNNSNIHGILLWNIFENPDDATDRYSQSPNLLFDSEGNPTQLYYALLRN